MATLTTTTYKQLMHYCEGATQTALYQGNAKYQQALKSLFEKYADEVYEVKGHVKGDEHCLDVEIEGEACCISHVEGYLEAWSVCKKSVAQMSPEKAAEQQAKFNQLFSK